MSRTRTTVTLTRDCPATTVPYGEAVMLDAGGEVALVQRLGGSITVQTPFGTLMRIDGADADALGLEPVDAVAGQGQGQDGGEDGRADTAFSMDQVMTALDGVYDPEIPVSIVALGLVYRCEEVLDGDHRRIEIDMTMTAPGCGMGDILRVDAERAVAAVGGVDEVEVNLVWDPPWTVHHMSEATKLELGLL